MLEESPAPGLSDDVRERLHQAAATAAAALGYRNAGTAEFLLAEDDSFYFLEMNRRLQVEHPVTEEIFGIDLVSWQLRLAAGETLPPPDAFRPRGHAMEARVYAEDPEHGFLPSSGTVHVLREAEGPGVRVDSALVAGIEISPYYDPLLAKVIVHGATRAEAIRRLDLALAETVVLGLRTNVGFLRRVLAHEAFCEGALRTDLLERSEDSLLAEPQPPPAAFLAAAAHALLPGAAGASAGARGAESEMPSPWTALPNFRLAEEDR